MHSLRDVPEHVLREIAHFFSTYKALEKKKWVKVISIIVYIGILVTALDVLLLRILKTSVCLSYEPRETVECSVDCQTRRWAVGKEQKIQRGFLRTLTSRQSIRRGRKLGRGEKHNSETVNYCWEGAGRVMIIALLARNGKVILT